MGYCFNKLIGFDMQTRISGVTNYRYLFNEFWRGLLDGTAAMDGVHMLNKRDLATPGAPQSPRRPRLQAGCALAGEL